MKKVNVWLDVCEDEHTKIVEKVYSEKMEPFLIKENQNLYLIEDVVYRFMYNSKCEPVVERLEK